ARPGDVPRGGRSPGPGRRGTRRRPPVPGAAPRWGRRSAPAAHGLAELGGEDAEGLHRRLRGLLTASASAVPPPCTGTAEAAGGHHRARPLAAPGVAIPGPFSERGTPRSAAARRPRRGGGAAPGGPPLSAAPPGRAAPHGGGALAAGAAGRPPSPAERPRPAAPATPAAPSTTLLTVPVRTESRPPPPFTHVRTRGSDGSDPSGPAGAESGRFTLQAGPSALAGRVRHVRCASGRRTDRLRPGGPADNGRGRVRRRDGLRDDRRAGA